MSEEFFAGRKVWQCTCGGFLDVNSSPPSIDKIQRRKPTLWRYREALPILQDQHILSFEEGFTPLIPVDFGKRPYG